MDIMKDRFEQGAKILIMIVAAMIPLWFLPLPVELEFGREVTFSLFIIAAFILWLLSLLTRGEMRYSSSLILWSVGLTILAFGASTAFSKAPLVSLTFGNPLAEKFSSLLLGVLLMLVVSSVCVSNKDVRRILSLLIGMSGIAGFIVFLQLAWGISILGRLSSYAQGNNFNVVGTMNGFALFLVTMFVLTLGLFFSPSMAAMRRNVRYAITAILVILMLDLMMIHFFTAWIVLLGCLIFFFGLMFMYMRRDRKQETDKQFVHKQGFDWRYSMLILLIALSVVMLVVKTPVFGSANLPAEVSPSLSATLSVGQHVLKEGSRALFFGSGPTTFNLDWARYRDPAINQTQFWNVSFTQGFSWISTQVATVGILGVFSFLLFLCLALIIFLRHLLRFPHEKNTPIGISIFLGFLAMILIAMLYPSSLTFVLMLFLFTGILMALLARPEPEALYAGERQETVRLAFDSVPAENRENEFKLISTKREVDTRAPGWWDITSRTIRFENSWLMFISSLLAIFFLSLGVAAIYLEIGRLRSALTSQRSVAMFNKGDADGAIAGFEQAAAFEDKNFSNYIPIVQARMEKIRGLIQKASSGNNVQQEFQNTASLAIQSSQQAINLNPANSALWRLQGSLYELFIPFIPGSENFAFNSYRKAIELDPLNPSLDIDLARSGLVAVDRLTLTIQQSQGADRDKLIQVRTVALQEIMEVLKKAVEHKPDLADSHFLATQAALRLGNVSSAITSAEKAKIAAPFDIGIAFQLGVLYYQSGDADKAQIEFERSVAINNNYSNARYFLGLIYDKKGDKSRAIQQFEQIEALNPTNQEVKHILENLRTGKPSLEGIVPPGQPPEKRNVAPVVEEKLGENK